MFESDIEEPMSYTDLKASLRYMTLTAPEETMLQLRRYAQGGWPTEPNMVTPCDITTLMPAMVTYMNHPDKPMGRPRRADKNEPLQTAQERILCRDLRVIVKFLTHQTIPNSKIKSKFEGKYTRVCAGEYHRVTNYAHRDQTNGLTLLVQGNNPDLTTCGILDTKEAYQCLWDEIKAIDLVKDNEREEKRDLTLKLEEKAEAAGFLWRAAPNAISAFSGLRTLHWSPVRVLAVPSDRSFVRCQL